MGSFWVAVIASIVGAALYAASTSAARPIIRRLREHTKFATELSTLWLKLGLAVGVVLLFVGVGWVLHQWVVGLLGWLGEMVSAKPTPADQPERLLPMEDLERFLAGAKSWPWQVSAAAMVAVSVFGSFRELGHVGGRPSGWAEWSMEIRATLLGGVMTLVLVLPVAAAAGLHLAIDWGLSSPSLADFPPPPGLAEWSLPWSVYWTILAIAAALGGRLLYAAIDMMFRMDNREAPVGSR